MWFAVALAAMLLSPTLLRRFPVAAALLAIAGAVLARSLLVEVGTFMGPLF